MKTAALKWKCRFPGCEFTTTDPRPRGRHENMVHGMSKGLLNGKAPTAQEPAPLKPAAPTRNGTETWNAAAHLNQAIADLEQRHNELAEQIAGLEALRSEFEDIGRQKAILHEALDRLQPAARPANV
jgi:hypothetical protein